MSYPAFTRIAPHYDALMETVPYEMWVTYFELLCARAEHKPRRVLDVCCGTGTVCELLSGKGLEMAGVDISEPMILCAREKAAAHGRRIDYFVQDIAAMNLGRTFDTAVSFFDSLNYVTDPEQLRRGLGRVATHLEPGGLFVFDLNTEYAFTHEMFDQESLRRDAAVRYRWRSRYDRASRLCTVKMEFWVGDPPREFVETHVQRAHSEHEMRKWLAEAGFERVETYNSYTLSRPNSRSDRVHYTAIRSA